MVAFRGGELSLLCLARLLLRCDSDLCSRHSAVLPPPPGLLLVDEATQGVDAAADAIVHATLLRRRETVISVCHRLAHVAHFDLVAVLAGGVICEIGPPAQLERMPGGVYAAMLAAAAATEGAR